MCLGWIAIYVWPTNLPGCKSFTTPANLEFVNSGLTFRPRDFSICLLLECHIHHPHRHPLRDHGISDRLGNSLQHYWRRRGQRRSDFFFRFQDPGKVSDPTVNLFHIGHEVGSLCQDSTKSHSGLPSRWYLFRLHRHSWRGQLANHEH
jgi:hypothetical protein